jgi:hypothetical protein
VNVIADSANRERFHLVLFRDAAQILPKSFLENGIKTRFAILRTPDTMNKTTGE